MQHDIAIKVMISLVYLMAFDPAAAPGDFHVIFYVIFMLSVYMIRY